MIKRPLVWILGTYLMGMYLAWQQKHSITILIMVLIAICFSVYLFVFRGKQKIGNHHDKFLWGLPLLFVIGYCAMRGQMELPKLYQAFESEAPCEVTGRITMIVEKQWGKALYITDNTVTLSRGDPDPYLCENIIVFCSENQYNSKEQNNLLVTNYLIGNQITVNGTLQKFSEASNPGQFNEQLYYQIENIDFKVMAEQIRIINAKYSKFHRVLGQIKNKLVQVYDTMLSDKESGALIAMLLGEKYLLNEEIKQLYQENGIAHVLAISGLHVSLIGLSIFQLLKRLKVPIALATFVSIFLIYCYGVLTYFSVSTNRAVVMMTIMLLAAIFGKTYDMLSATALSAFLILLQNPLQLLSVGFLLSYGAVLGIAILLPCLQKLFPTTNSLVSGLFISISAQATTTPLVLLFYYQLPVYSVVTNLLILPFVTVLMLTSLLAGIAGAIYMPIGIFLIGGANYILKFYEWVCRVVNSLPNNLITVGKPQECRILLYFILLSFFAWYVKRYNKKHALLILIVSFFLLLIPRKNIGLEITMLDVGQGEAIFLESESGTTYLIDGGSADVKKVGTYRIQPFLLSQGVGRIDYAIMTHSDYDHISGLKELIENGKIEIRHLILPYIISKDDSYIELEALAKNKKIQIQYIQTGDILQDGDLKMVCLHPSPNYQASSCNSYSTVLSVTYGEFDMLLTGDLEKEGELIVTKLLENASLCRKYGIKPIADYDILKVAHHGSKNSTFEEFLQKIQPELSIISCGKDNWYGHPHEELLHRLDQIGSNIKITYESGAITIKTDGKLLVISEYRVTKGRGR